MSFENEVYSWRLFREPSEMICLSCGLTGHTTSSCATPLQNAAADVLSESPNKLPLTRLLELYCLEDEAGVLASNGIKKNRDLYFINDDVIKDFSLSTVSKAKLRKLVKALGAPASEETKARQAFTAAKSKNADRPLRRIQSVEIVRDDELDLHDTEKSSKNVDEDESSRNFQEKVRASELSQ